MSESQIIRQKGNEFYKKALIDGTSLIFQKDWYMKACKKYHQALQVACKPDDYSSAAKNIGMSYWKLGLVCHDLGLNTSLKMEYFYISLDHLTKSLKEAERSRCMKNVWMADVDLKVKKCLNEILETLDSLDLDEQIKRIDEISSKLGEDTIALLECYHHLIDMQIKMSVMKCDGENFRETLVNLGGCDFYIEEMKRLSRRHEKKSWYHLMVEKDEVVHVGRRGREEKKPFDYCRSAEVFEEDLLFLRCTAQSARERLNGDKIIAKAVAVAKDEDSVPYNIMLLALDHYKHAIILARGVDLEQECIALSAVGQLHHKFFKNKLNAKRYLQSCMELSLSQPRSQAYSSEKWFIECSAILKMYQQEVLDKEKKAHEAERQKYLDELKDEMKKLTELNNKYADMSGDEAFIVEILDTFPPKISEKSTKEDGDKQQQKKEDGEKVETEVSVKTRIQKTIFIYHPDRQAKYGKKWQVLSEEITKLLTKRYEARKG